MNTLTKELRAFTPFGFGFLQLIVDDYAKAIDYIFLDVSVGFQKMIGLHRENFIGKRASEIFLGKKAQNRLD